MAQELWHPVGPSSLIPLQALPAAGLLHQGSAVGMTNRSRRPWCRNPGLDRSVLDARGVAMPGDGDSPPDLGAASSMPCPRSGGGPLEDSCTISQPLEPTPSSMTSWSCRPRAQGHYGPRRQRTEHDRYGTAPACFAHPRRKTTSGSRRCRWPLPAACRQPSVSPFSGKANPLGAQQLRIGKLAASAFFENANAWQGALPMSCRKKPANVLARPTIRRGPRPFGKVPPPAKGRAAPLTHESLPGCTSEGPTQHLPRAPPATGAVPQRLPEIRRVMRGTGPLKSPHPRVWRPRMVAVNAPARELSKPHPAQFWSLAFLRSSATDAKKLMQSVSATHAKPTSSHFIDAPLLTFSNSMGAPAEHAE